MVRGEHAGLVGPVQWVTPCRSPGAAQKEKLDKFYQPARVAQRLSVRGIFFPPLKQFFFCLKNASNIEVFPIRKKKKKRLPFKRVTSRRKKKNGTRAQQET